MEGSQIKFPPIYFLPLKFDFVSANSADPDEIPHNLAFHLGLHCLPRFQVSNGLRETHNFILQIYLCPAERIKMTHSL